jgi:capsular polysaccharide biosynthesis protein
MVAAVRLARTRLTLAGFLDSAERRQRRATTAALAALPRAAIASNRRVLIFSLRGGWYPHTAWEAVLGQALRIRGAGVHVFNCGGVMPICEVNFRHADPRIACTECRLYPDTLVGALGLERSWLADYLTDADRDEISAAVGRLTPAHYEAWTFDEKPVGALVRNSVLWFLRKSRLNLDTNDAAVYRDFLVAGACIARMAPRLLEATRPDVIIELNGLFFAEQILNTFAPAGCRVAAYEAGWRMNSLGFDWLGAAGFADVDAPWSRLKDQPLTAQESATLDAWIDSRRAGDMQRDFYVRFDAQAPTDALSALGLRPDLPTTVLFTNLVWDTAVFGRDTGFRSIQEWLRATVEWFRHHPDRQLVVRIHPAEDLRPSQESNEKLSELVRDLSLPGNAVMVPSAAPLSSYALIEAASAVMVYTSTAGLEAALYGKRVLVGARVYYAGRGFTQNVGGADAIGRQLEDAFIRPNLTPDERDLARRFAYLLLFRFLHDIPVVKQRPRTLPLLAAEEAIKLAPTAGELDALFEGLLTGAPLARM